MATIVDIIRQRKGRAGSNGSWRVEPLDSDPFVGSEFALFHYSTLMARWRESKRNGVELLEANLGHGSVSDQGGMNTFFKVLALPYRYSRAGGAEIEKLDIDQETLDACARLYSGRNGAHAMYRAQRETRQRTEPVWTDFDQVFLSFYDIRLEA